MKRIPDLRAVANKYILNILRFQSRNDRNFPATHQERLYLSRGNHWTAWTHWLMNEWISLRYEWLIKLFRSNHRLGFIFRVGSRDKGNTHHCSTSHRPLVDHSSCRLHQTWNLLSPLAPPVTADPSVCRPSTAPSATLNCPSTGNGIKSVSPSTSAADCTAKRSFALPIRRLKNI